MKSYDEIKQEVLLNMSLNQYRSNKTPYRRGQTLFKMNIENFEVSRVNGDEIIKYDRFNKPYRTINVKFEIGYIYIACLNIQNAIKQFSKIQRIVHYKVLQEVEREKNNKEDATIPLANDLIEPASLSLEGENDITNIQL